ncbi:MAG: HAMP domain-containing sensor histidine kinase [Deltaproteobacteria bacterium]
MKLALRLFPLKLRTLLLLANLFVLATPVVGLVGMRIYQNELVRQTEVELYAQAAFVEAVYVDALGRVLAATRDGRSRLTLDRYAEKRGLVAAAPRGVQAAGGAGQKSGQTKYFREGRMVGEVEFTQETGLHPIEPSLDLGSSPVLEFPVFLETPDLEADAMAIRAGMALKPLLGKVQQTTLASIKVFDHQGVAVAASNNVLGFAASGLVEVKSALAGEVRSVFRRRAREPLPANLLLRSLTSMVRAGDRTVYVGFPIIGQGHVLGAVLLARTPRNPLKALFTKRRELAVALVLATVLAMWVAAMTAIGISRPIKALVGQARAVAAGDPAGEMAIPRPGTEEVAVLSNTLASTAASLEQRSKYIREFARGVSHELKTPLSAIKAGVELLGEHATDMSNEDRKRFLGNVSSDVDRLESLTARLLELARAEVLVARPGDKVDLDRVMDKLTGRFESQGLAVVYECRKSPCMVAIAPDIAETVFVNLISNARNHGATEVTVVARDRGPAGVEITVADNGSGVADENIYRIFDPFFTTAPEKSGTGLGLTLVRSHLDAYGGTIALLPGGNSGACFKLSLPAA